MQAEIFLPIVPRALPFCFADLGNAGDVGDVFARPPLIGAGFGMAFPLLIAELRRELSKAVGVGSAGPVRFDIRIK